MADDDTLDQCITMLDENPELLPEEPTEEEDFQSCAADAQTMKEDLQVLLELEINPVQPASTSFTHFSHIAATTPLWRGQAKPILSASERAEQWANHDPTVTLLWDKLVEDIMAIDSRIRVGSMTKPCGPLNAALTVVWHYPTWRTKQMFWGSVLDSSNPCTKSQCMRFGKSPFVRTPNRNPIKERFQEGSIAWNFYNDWDQIEALCSKFNHRLNATSKIIIVVGKENNDDLGAVIDLNETYTEDIAADSSQFLQPHVFGQPPSIKLIRSVATTEIQHAVLSVHHPQHFFYRTTQMCVRAYHDLLWNAAADMIGIDVHAQHIKYFVHQAHVRKPSPRDQYVNSQFELAKNLRGQEKRLGRILSEDIIRRL